MSKVKFTTSVHAAFFHSLDRYCMKRRRAKVSQRLKKSCRNWDSFIAKKFHRWCSTLHVYTLWITYGVTDTDLSIVLGFVQTENPTHEVRDAGKTWRDAETGICCYTRHLFSTAAFANLRITTLPWYNSTGTGGAQGAAATRKRCHVWSFVGYMNITNVIGYCFHGNYKSPDHVTSTCVSTAFPTFITITLLHTN